MLLLGRHRFGADLDTSNVLLNLVFLAPLSNVFQAVEPLATSLDIVPGTWSLNPEIWFYGSMPILALIISRFRHSLSAFMLLTTAIGAVFVRASFSPTTVFTLKQSIVGVFDSFLIGMAVAAISLAFSVSRGWRWLFPVGVVLYFANCAGYLLPVADYYFQIGVAGGFMILGLIAKGPSDCFRASLEKTWIVAIGRWSYGLFMCNIIVAWYLVLPLSQALGLSDGAPLFILNFLIGFPLMIFLAATSFKYIEQPILRKQPILVKHAFLRVGGLMVMLIGSALLFAVLASGHPDREFSVDRWIQPSRATPATP